MTRSSSILAAVGLTLLSVSMPVHSETRSGSKHLCVVAYSGCGMFNASERMGGGSVDIRGRAKGFDEDRFSFTTQVSIRNNTRCRLQVAFIGIEHGNNAMSLDPGSVFIEAGDEETSSEKTFVMSKSAFERGSYPELNYSLAVSDCDD